MGVLYFYTQPENPSTVIYSWRNFDRQRQLNATLNLRHRLSFYEPSLTLMWMKNMQEVALAEGVRTIDRPLFIISLNNSLHLPSGFFANIEYQYQSAGSAQIFTFEPSHVFGLSLSKSFLSGALEASLKARDLFGREINRYTGDYSNMTFYQREDRDRRSLSLHLVYRFNNFKKSYKGRNAADDEINRLK